MVLCKPHHSNDEKAQPRKTAERDGVLYQVDMFRITAPASSHLISRLKGALSRDKYRIHVTMADKEFVIAQADSFEEIYADWTLVTEKVLAQVLQEPALLKELPNLIAELVRYKPSGYRRPSASNALRAQRERFEDRLQRLHIKERSGHLDAYELFRTLGTGSFGRVLLCKDKASGRYYAMKIIKKEIVIKLKQMEHTANEKNILACIDCPFIIHMTEYFQDRRSLYFILEYVNGGEMFTHIHRNRYFSYDVAKFYAAEIVLAFEYLHNLDIVYRDLKPENLLLDYKGHVRITDFGFAKRVTDRTWTLCGTPEYLAPEIILSKGYAHAVDWWALGVLIFEMRCGQAPFYDHSQMEMYRKIVDGSVVYPVHFKPDERDIIGSFLTGDLTKRLGNMKAVVQDIKTHKYFKGILFDSLYQGNVPSPYVPRTSGEGDNSNFDKYDEESITWADESVPDPYGDMFADF